VSRGIASDRACRELTISADLTCAIKLHVSEVQRRGIYGVAYTIPCNNVPSVLSLTAPFTPPSGAFSDMLVGIS
jgi:hypothetical protein